MIENKKNISNEVTQLLHSTNLLKLSIYILSIFSIKYKKYKIEKIFELKKISINPAPQILYKNLNRLEITYLISRKYQKEISNFFSTLSKKNPNLDFDLLAHNLKKLSLKEKHSVLFINNYKKNNIFFIKNNKLFHFSYIFLQMAASFSFDEKECCGFYMYDKKNKTSIGEGINDGYTEWLSIKYFGNLTSLYVVEKYIAYEIEKIIGKKMEDFYFKADLENFINELSEYESKENVITFIRSVDYINKHLKFGNNSYIDSSFSNIYNFLLSLYIKKIKKDLKNSLIDENKINNQLFSFLADMSHANIINRESKINYDEINKLVIILKERIMKDS